MGCFANRYSVEILRQGSGEEMPPILQQKTMSKEELRLSPANYIMLVHGELATSYEVIEQIGEGGYGTVWKVKHRSSGQLRAAKTMLKTNLDEEQREEMLAEVSTLRLLVLLT